MKDKRDVKREAEVSESAGSTKSNLAQEIREVMKSNEVFFDDVEMPERGKDEGRG